MTSKADSNGNNPVEPNHYRDLPMSPLEYLTINEDNEYSRFSWCIGNVVKYVSRYRNKNGIEDLKKALFYLEYQIKLEEEKEQNTAEVIHE